MEDVSSFQFQDFYFPRTNTNTTVYGLHSKMLDSITTKPFKNQVSGFIRKIS